MTNFTTAVWIELLKARRSNVPWLTAVGFLILPLACAFMMFIYKDPEFARNLGLISTKANLVGGTADWPFYLNMMAQGLAIGGILLFGLVESWIFGREFSDGTVKDLLSVPIGRGVLLAAKFFVAALWCAGLVGFVVAVALVLGFALGLPLGSATVFWQGGVTLLVTSLLVLLNVTPVAFFASVGRGYLLPMGLVAFGLVLANVVAIAGWGSYFPWSIPALYANLTGTGSLLEPASLWVVVFTGIAGMGATCWWWKNVDQNR